MFKGLQELCRTVADMVYPNLVDGYNRVINDINRGVRTFETYFESIQEYEEYTKTLTNIQDIGKFDQATIGAYVPSTSELEGELLDALGVGANTLERNELKSYIQSIKKLRLRLLSHGCRWVCHRNVCRNRRLQRIFYKN